MPFIVANYIFVAWLVLEVSLNLYAQRCRYFGGPDIRTIKQTRTKTLRFQHVYDPLRKLK